MNKYREGKMERTLKRGLKVPETVTGEADCVSERLLCCSAAWRCIQHELCWRGCADAGVFAALRGEGSLCTI